MPYFLALSGFLLPQHVWSTGLNVRRKQPQTLTSLVSTVLQQYRTTMDGAGGRDRSVRNASLSKPGNRVWTQTPRVARAPAAAALAREGQDTESEEHGGHSEQQKGTCLKRTKSKERIGT